MSDLNEQAKTLLEEARQSDIKLPKGKKECMAAAKAAMEEAEEKGGRSRDYCLKVLKKKFGVTKKTTGKRKAKSDNEEVEQGKGSEPASKSKSASSVKADLAVLDEVWDASDKPKRKEQAVKLVQIAKSRGVKMPEDDNKARVGAGRSLLGIKEEDFTYKVKDVIDDLASTFGMDPSWVDPDASKAKKKRPSKAKQCNNSENEGLAEMFGELSKIYFKEKEKAGMVYAKVATAIKDLEEPLTAPPKKGQIKGVGAKSIALIKEFLETGTTELLEEKRAASAEM